MWKSPMIHMYKVLTDPISELIIIFFYSAFFFSE